MLRVALAAGLVALLVGLVAVVDHRRELGYRIGFLALSASALGLAAIGLRRRHG